MVAYSFKPRFVGPIAVGLGLSCPNAFGVTPPTILPKRQSIRADRKRHARVGEELQLYCGMRTKNCFLIGRARCTSVESVTMKIGKHSLCILIGGDDGKVGMAVVGGYIHDFARADGFENGDDMLAFWQKEHPVVSDFMGVLIRWEPLS